MRWQFDHPPQVFALLPTTFPFPWQIWKKFQRTRDSSGYIAVMLIDPVPDRIHGRIVEENRSKHEEERDTSHQNGKKRKRYVSLRPGVQLTCSTFPEKMLTNTFNFLSRLTSSVVRVHSCFQRLAVPKSHLCTQHSLPPSTIPLLSSPCSTLA